MDEQTVLRAAEVIVAHESLLVLEEVAAAAACASGVCVVPVVPGSDVLQLIVCDGIAVGRVRREYPWATPERWVAVPRVPQRPHGPFRTMEDAAHYVIAHTEQKGATA